MNPVTHALCGFLLAGPAGAVVSVAPDVPLAVGHLAVRGRWLSDRHPVRQTHLILHTFIPVLALLPWPRLALCWALHVALDLATHGPGLAPR